MKPKRAQINSKNTTTRKLQVTIEDRGVFFDIILLNYKGEVDSRQVLLHTTETRARNLAQWILKSTEAHGE